MTSPRFSAVLAFSLLLAFSGFAHASNWTLMNAARVNTGGLPASVVSADFNHDGIPDLVTVQHKRNGNIIFYPGKGDGKFGKKVLFKTTGDPVYIVTGDFDKDGNTDIAVALFDNKAKFNPGTVQIFLGLNRADIVAGAWPFNLTVAFNTVGIRPISIAAADLNGDGILDLAVTNFGDGKTPGQGTVSELIGKGDGTFKDYLTDPADKLIFSAGVNPRQIVAADFNADGVPDLAVTNMDKDANTARIMFADTTTVGAFKHGTGRFTSFSTIPMPDEKAMPWGIDARDLDGDGSTDLVVTESGKKKLDVRFGNTSSVVMDTNSGPDFVLINDINQDGKPDLLVGEGGSNVISVFMNKGGRVFDTRKDFIAGAFPISMAVADLNRDGDPDIVSADNKSGALSVFLAKVTAKGAWGFVREDFDGGSWPKGLSAGAFTNATEVIADFKLDGNPVKAVIDNTNKTVAFGNATGVFTPYTTVTLSGHPSAIAAADINRDGKPDAAVATDNGGGTVTVLFGDGAGTFPTVTDFGVGVNPASMAVGDFGDPNGWLDVATSAAFPPNPALDRVSVLFGQEQFEVTLEITGSGSVVQVVGANEVPLAPGTHTFEAGKDVTLRAVPAAGSIFKSWGGGVAGTKTDITFTLKTKMTVKAIFVAGS